MYSSFLRRISEDLHIEKGPDETVASWENRILYSYLSLNMLTASYDCEETIVGVEQPRCKTVSKQHVIKRAEELVGTVGVGRFHLSIFDNIRKNYIATGYLLNCSNRFAPPPKQFGTAGAIQLSRGELPWDVQYMSGSGTYEILAGEDHQNQLWDDLFCIMKKPIMEWFLAFKSTLHWKNISQLPANTEYANMHNIKGLSYWINKPSNVSITIMRDSQNYGGRQYHLIRKAHPFEVSILPEWLAKNEEYLRVALALRIRYGCEHKLHITYDGAIAHLRSDYLLPPAEQNFYEMFSWPSDMENGCAGNRWNRTVSIHVLPVIKTLFLRMGFRLDEE